MSGEERRALPTTPGGSAAQEQDQLHSTAESVAIEMDGAERLALCVGSQENSRLSVLRGPSPSKVTST